MGDRVSSSALLPCSGIVAPSSKDGICNWKPRRVGAQSLFFRNSSITSSRSGGSVLIGACLGEHEAETSAPKSTKPLRVSRNSVPAGPGGYEFDEELGFKERENEQLELKTARDNRRETQKSTHSVKVSRKSAPTGSSGHEIYRELGFKENEKEQIEFEMKREKQNSNRDNRIDIGRKDEETVSSGVNLMDQSEAKSMGRLEIEDLVRTEEGRDGMGSKLEQLDQDITGQVTVRRRRRQMKRSNMLAKQVISIQSALSQGFVSQLWVDTISWLVLVVEVRPNLLSGEVERFLLQDVSQVGDVVLIEDEVVMENELKMVGLETLVGYNVVTPGRQRIGKVRGYTFDINSGALESLELDSFGISVIPSSLVSTYALPVEDVLEVVSDAVVVHEAAASSIQRLTKGFWDAKTLGTSIEDFGNYSDFEAQSSQHDYGGSQRKSSTGRKYQSRKRESLYDVDGDWELPKDYL
ncbi:hypothetical protein NMG60_11035907 [Bertholletia excelsa]